MNSCKNAYAADLKYTHRARDGQALYDETTYGEAVAQRISRVLGRSRECTDAGFARSRTGGPWVCTAKWRRDASVRAPIRSVRLELRELTLRDDEFILQLLNEHSFLRFIGDKGVRTLSDAREYIAQGPIASYRRRGFGLYLTCLRDGATPIGICGLVKRESLEDVDLGFARLSRHCSLGYATESAAAVLAFGREVLALPRIVAITAPDNDASIAVLGRVGLRFERMIRLAADSPELKLFV